MTSKSVKIRSLILTALMVFSVFAGTVALTGSAAAAGNVDGTAADVNKVTHYEDSSNNPVLEISFNEDIASSEPDSDTEIYVTLEDGTTVEAYDDSSWQGDFGTNAAGSRANFDTARIVFGTDTTYNTVENVTINGITDADGETLSENRTVDVRFAPTTVDTTDTDGSEVEAYQGANVSLVDGTSLDSDWDISGYDNNVDITRGSGQNSEVYVFNTEGRELGEYEVEGPTNSINLTLQDLGLSAESEESTFDSDDAIEGTIESNAINRQVDLELLDDDGDTVEETTVDTGADGEVDYSFAAPSDDWDAGNYTVEATDVNTRVTASTDEFEIVEAGDTEASFGQSNYQEARGDVLNVSIELDNTDTATVQFGDFEDDNYNITAEVVDDDEDGVAYVEFNSFTAGFGGASPSNVLVAGDDDTDVSNVSQGGSFEGDAATVGEEILEASDYDLLVEAGEMSGTTVDNEDNVATLTLSERSTDSANIWVAPEDGYSDLSDTDADGVVEYVEAGNLTQTGTIAEGDTMVVEVSANGLEGALETDDYQSLSASAEFFSLTFEEQTSAANADPASANVSSLSSDNVSVIYADTEGSGADTHYVVINSENLTEQFSHEDGDGYVANFTVWDEGAGNSTPTNDNNDLTDENVSVEDNANIEDPEVDVDTDSDDNVVLGAGDGQEITGDTNFAPGTELTIRVRSDGAPVPFLEQPEPVVQSDGTFTAVVNFSAENEGGNFTVQPRLGSTNIGSSYDGYLVEATEEPETEEPTDDGTATEEPTAPATDTEEPTEEETTMGEMTEEPTTMAGTDAEETTTGSGGPGFTAAIALIALVAAALLAVRRDN